MNRARCCRRGVICARWHRDGHRKDVTVLGLCSWWKLSVPLTYYCPAAPGPRDIGATTEPTVSVMCVSENNAEGCINAG